MTRSNWFDGHRNPVPALAVKSLCGAILLSADPAALAQFYGTALELAFTREDHGGLAPHFGVDIGQIHFGIHPPGNFRFDAGQRGRNVLAFNVTSLAECEARLVRLKAPCLMPAHDEGFGVVACYADPEGNPFEIVELDYEFAAAADGSGPRG